MYVKIPFTCAVSQKIVSKKDGREWNKLQGSALGIGLFSLFVAEEKVPDDIEGKTLTAVFKVGVDKNFSPYLRLDSFEL